MYEHLPSPAQGPAERQDSHRHGDERINTSKWYIIYTSLLLLIFIACAGFWGASRKTALVFSLSSTQNIEGSPKTFTFVWTLLGTVLAFTTGSLFNQLLKISVQQNVAAYGLKIGLLEFSSRLYARKWLHDHHHRLLLSIFSVIFAVAFGLLVSAYTGLLTPTRVYVQSTIYGSEIDITSAAFNTWVTNTGSNVLLDCSTLKTYGTGSKAVTLPLCPQVKDPLPYVEAGLSAIEGKYARFDPTTDVLGLSFNGTTKGVLPRGWNTMAYFDTFPQADLPPVGNYNYSMTQQAILANVSCSDVGKASNITWKNQGEYLFNANNGVSSESIYLQNLTYGGVNTPYGSTTYNLLVSGSNMIATFDYGYPDPYYQITRMDLSSYGNYASDWRLPNLTCLIEPYIAYVNVTYSNSTGMFAAEVLSVPDYTLPWARTLAEVGSWLFRVFIATTGNQIINSIIALQNTPSYESNIHGNVTINWPSAIELLLQGMVEYHGTRLRMILEAESNSTQQHDGFHVINGTVSSWRLGYNGATGSVVILFPLMAFVLLCSITVIGLGIRTGVDHVTRFDPTNTTHIIIASALGGRSGNLNGLAGEHAIHADDKALNLKVNYQPDQQSFREVHGDAPRGYTELENLQPVEQPGPSKTGLFTRRPFVRLRTG